MSDISAIPVCRQAGAVAGEIDCAVAVCTKAPHTASRLGPAGQSSLTGSSSSPHAGVSVGSPDNIRAPAAQHALRVVRAGGPARHRKPGLAQALRAGRFREMAHARNVREPFLIVIPLDTAQLCCAVGDCEVAALLGKIIKYYAGA